MALGRDGVGPPADLQGEVHRRAGVEESADALAEPSRAQAAPRLPDFFVAGHAKSGTTALYFMLRSHPQIHMPVKEPRFFAPELRTRFWRPESSRRLRPRTLEGYRALFAGAAPAQRVGEATPSYLRSSTAAARIAAVEPGARIIAILREPASFLRSFHLQSVRNYDETERDLRKAMALEEARRQGKRIPLLSQAPSGLLYSDHVRYVEQLRRYHAVFPPEQVLVLIYDDFRADNEGTVRQVLRFLEVDDTVPIPKIEFETLRTPRFQWLDQLSRAISIARRHNAPLGAIARTLDALTPTRLQRSDALGSLRRRIRYTDAPPPDEEFMLELRRRFKPEVEAVSDYLGRDLVKLWGYDSLR
jgi:hypothetical protein